VTQVFAAARLTGLSTLSISSRAFAMTLILFPECLLDTMIQVYHIL